MSEYSGSRVNGQEPYLKLRPKQFYQTYLRLFQSLIRCSMNQGASITHTPMVEEFINSPIVARSRHRDRSTGLSASQQSGNSNRKSPRQASISHIACGIRLYDNCNRYLEPHVLAESMFLATSDLHIYVSVIDSLMKQRSLKKRGKRLLTILPHVNHCRFRWLLEYLG